MVLWQLNSRTEGGNSNNLLLVIKDVCTQNLSSFHKVQCPEDILFHSIWICFSHEQDSRAIGHVSEQVISVAHVCVPLDNYKVPPRSRPRKPHNTICRWGFVLPILQRRKLRPREKRLLLDLLFSIDYFFHGSCPKVGISQVSELGMGFP